MKLPQRQALNKKVKSSALSGSYSDLPVEGLSHDGRGIVRIQGKTVFVEGTVPNDIVTIKITLDEPNFAEARLQHRQEDSPQRVSPFCSYFGICGGCQLQHLSLTAQQDWKQRNFEAMLQQHLDCRKLQIEPLVSANDRGYRRRARFVVGKDAKTKQACLGFRQADSHHLVDIEQCPILTPNLNQALNQLRFDYLTQASRQLREIQLVEADNGVFIDATRFNQPLEGQPFYQLGDLTLHFATDSFIQVNRVINEALVNKAVDWLDLKSNSHVLDLFCGVGNFTLPIAQKAERVVGVEGNAQAVAFAQQNAAQNQLDNIQFYQADLFEAANNQAWWRTEYDRLLLDPGRLGALHLSKQLGELQAEKIVYVSCNSATLTRDIKQLELQGYRLSRAGVFDMFPHTTHFESLVLLEKR